jgi:hypothetical protein
VACKPGELLAAPVHDALHVLPTTVLQLCHGPAFGCCAGLLVHVVAGGAALHNKVCLMSHGYTCTTTRCDRALVSW